MTTSNSTKANATDAERYAWFRDVGMFDPQLVGRLIASGAASDTLDRLVDEAMARDRENRERDAERYAWLRSGGFFHHAMGSVGPSHATDDAFDALIDEAMARDAVEAEDDDE